MPRDRKPRRRPSDPGDDEGGALVPSPREYADSDQAERAADLQRRLSIACERWARDHDRDHLEKQKPHVSFTAERRIEFLAALEITGNRQLAADLVGVNVRTPRKHCENDKTFAEDCKIAEDRFVYGTLVATAVRRAVEGVTEPVFQGGMHVGDRQVYSDRLLEQQLKARVPEFRDKVGIEHSGGVSVTAGVLVVAADRPRSVEEWEEAHALPPIAAPDADSTDTDP